MKKKLKKLNFKKHTIADLSQVRGGDGGGGGGFGGGPPGSGIATCVGCSAVEHGNYSQNGNCATKNPNICG